MPIVGAMKGPSVFGTKAVNIHSRAPSRQTSKSADARRDGITITASGIAVPKLQVPEGYGTD